jgi:hypothetical protein
MKNKNNIFKTNQHKAASKVMINSYMMGGLFFVFTLVWTIKGTEVGPFIMGELIAAIPLLFVSSQAYTKVGCYEDVKYWEYFAWHVNNIGDILILSVIGLFVSKFYPILAYEYFIFMLFLMFAYTLVNMKAHPGRFWGKVYKYLFFVSGVVLFGLLPLIMRLV